MIDDCGTKSLEMRAESKLDDLSHLHSLKYRSEEIYKYSSYFLACWKPLALWKPLQPWLLWGQAKAPLLISSRKKVSWLRQWLPRSSMIEARSKGNSHKKKILPRGTWLYKSASLRYLQRLFSHQHGLILQDEHDNESHAGFSNRIWRYAFSWSKSRNSNSHIIIIISNSWQTLHSFLDTTPRTIINQPIFIHYISADPYVSATSSSIFGRRFEEIGGICKESNIHREHIPPG